MLQKSLSGLFNLAGFLRHSWRRSFLEVSGFLPPVGNVRVAPEPRTSDQVMGDLAAQAIELFKVRPGFDVHVDRDGMYGPVKGVHVKYRGPHFADPSIEIEAVMNLTPQSTYPKEKPFNHQPDGTIFSHLVLKTAEDKKMRKRPPAYARDRGFVTFDAATANELIRFGELTVGKKLSYHRPPTRVEQMKISRSLLAIRLFPELFMGRPAMP